MEYYIDTSVIVSIIVNDSHSVKAAAWFDRIEPNSLVSSLAKAEFSAAISRLVRTRYLPEVKGRDALRLFDHWLDNDASFVKIGNDDIESADIMVRDFKTGLLAPDAIHLAVTKRLDATLVTFDQRLAEAARYRNVTIVVPD